MKKSRLELIGTVTLGVAVTGVALWFLLEPRPERRHVAPYRLWGDVPASPEEPAVATIADDAPMPSAVDHFVEIARPESVADQAPVASEPRLEVILVLRNLEALPPDPCKLVVRGPVRSGSSGSLGAPRSRGPGGESAPPSPPGEFRLSLGRPGEHTVAFRVQRSGRSVGDVGLSATFQVEDRPGVQRIPIRLDAARVAQLVKQLGE